MVTQPSMLGTATRAGSATRCSPRSLERRAARSSALAQKRNCVTNRRVGDPQDSCFPRPARRGPRQRPRAASAASGDPRHVVDGVHRGHGSRPGRARACAWRSDAPTLVVWTSDTTRRLVVPLVSRSSICRVRAAQAAAAMPRSAARPPGARAPPACGIAPARSAPDRPQSFVITSLPRTARLPMRA